VPRTNADIRGVTHKEERNSVGHNQKEAEALAIWHVRKDASLARGSASDTDAGGG